MAPDTNFKEQDPKKQYNTDDNRKDRSGSYDAGQDFDPTEGYDNHPDDQYTSDMVKEEDEFLYEAGHGHSDEEEAEDAEESEDDDVEDAEYDDDYAESVADFGDTDLDEDD